MKLMTLVFAISSVTIMGEQPSVTLEQKAGPPNPTITVRAGGFLNFSILSSTNFTKWLPRIDVFGKHISLDVADHTVDAENSATRYYKAADLQNEPSNMLTKWKALGISRYRFDFTRVCGCTPAVLTATVTVENGQVLTVDNVQPYMTTMSDFKTVDEIYDIFISQLNTADLLTIHYDTTRFFPEWLEINPDYATQGDELLYRIDNFLALP